MSNNNDRNGRSISNRASRSGSSAKIPRNLGQRKWLALSAWPMGIHGSCSYNHITLTTSVGWCSERRLLPGPTTRANGSLTFKQEGSLSACGFLTRRLPVTALSNRDIRELLLSGELTITPHPSPDVMSPSAIDLTLGSRFEVPRVPGGPAAQVLIDSRDSQAAMAAVRAYCEVQTIVDGRPFLLDPGMFVLAWTRERVSLPSWLAARVEGRSTLARLGLSVHQTAPTVHATLEGDLQLELSNAGPFSLQLYPGQRICQLILETTTTPSSSTLQSVHQYQSGADR